MRDYLSAYRPAAQNPQSAVQSAQPRQNAPVGAPNGYSSGDMRPTPPAPPAPPPAVARPAMPVGVTNGAQAIMAARKQSSLANRNPVIQPVPQQTPIPVGAGQGNPSLDRYMSPPVVANPQAPLPSGAMPGDRNASLSGRMRAIYQQAGQNQQAAVAQPIPRKSVPVVVQPQVAPVANVQMPSGNAPVERMSRSVIQNRPPGLTGGAQAIMARRNKGDRRYATPPTMSPGRNNI